MMPDVENDQGIVPFPLGNYAKLIDKDISPECLKFVRDWAYRKAMEIKTVNEETDAWRLHLYMDVYHGLSGLVHEMVNDA